jgi:hypothetical protein
MNLIHPLKALLAPLLVGTSFVLDDVGGLKGNDQIQHGVLEYHGTLKDGRVVLFGFYQLPDLRMISAELWVPGAAGLTYPKSNTEQMARRRRVWSYDQTADVEGLTRAIVAEVVGWLQCLAWTTGPDAVTPPSGD